MTIAQADKDEIVGEAYALRALHYHNLVKLFGGVPLVLTQPGSVEDANKVVRATTAEVYAQIESDLQQAETAHLQSDGTDQYRDRSVAPRHFSRGSTCTRETTPRPSPRRMK